MSYSKSKVTWRGDRAEGRDCNIGPREQFKRRLMGIVGLARGAGLSFLTVVSEAPRWSRLVVFIPIWLAGLGLFQAREKTCIALAARGARNLDAGEEEIGDHALAARLRARADGIRRRSLTVAGVITLVVLIFP